MLSPVELRRLRQLEKSGFADAQLATHFRHRGTGLGLLEGKHDLRLGELGSLHGNYVPSSCHNCPLFSILNWRCFTGGGHDQQKAIGVVMKVLELQLPEQTASKLQEAAERLSVSPEQLSILSIEEKLAQLEEEFRRSAEYALQKNADLYRRLV